MSHILILVLSSTVLLARVLGQVRGPGEGEFKELAEKAAKAQRDGESDDAVVLYLKALQIRPAWADGWRSVGVLLAHRRDFLQAEAAFRKLLDIEPKNGAGWALLGLCEYELGHYDQAYQHIQQGRTLGVGSAALENVATYQAALVLIQKGEFPVAQSLLTRVARSGTDDADLITALGLAALRIPSAPDKLDAQQKSLVTRVGQIEFQSRHSPMPPEKVVEAYDNLLAELPTTLGLHYALGNYLFNIAHYDEGLRQMRKELELDPDDVMALLQVALTCVKINEPEEALSAAEKAVRLAPDLFATHYALGWTLFKLGQNDRSIPELEQAVRLGPHDARAHYALSEAYAKANRKANALREREIFARLKQEQEPPSKASTAEERSRTITDKPLPQPQR